MKIITGREFVDAIEKDGLPQTRGYYFRTADESADDPDDLNGKKIESACAIGQAAINLSVLPYSSPTAVFSPFEQLMGRIIRLNDNEGLALPEIVRTLREEFPDLDAITAEFQEFDYSKLVG